MTIKILKCNKDNYSYLLQEQNKGIIIDPGNFQDIKNNINNCNIEYILLTHKHNDHSGAVPRLLETFPNAKIIDFRSKTTSILGYNIEVIKTPGHTKDSCCFYFRDLKIIFTGDTLFTSCCGRVIDGTYKELYESLNQIMKLPIDIRIYPGHEYLKLCLRFIDYIKGNVDEYKKYFSKDYPSVGVLLRDELKNNPFLTEDYEIFKKYRELKNSV